MVLLAPVRVVDVGSLGEDLSRPWAQTRDATPVCAIDLHGGVTALCLTPSVWIRPPPQLRGKP